MTCDNITLNVRIVYSKKRIIFLIEQAIKTTKNKIMLMGSLYLPSRNTFFERSVFQIKGDISIKII